MSSLGDRWHCGILGQSEISTDCNRGGYGLLCRVQKYCILSNAPSSRAQLEHGRRGGRTSTCSIQHTMFSKHGVQFAHSVADVLKQILRAVSMYGNAQISERYVPTTDINTATPKKGPWKLLHLCYQNILFMKSKHKNKHF